jgi:hypothetical protein
MPNGPFPWFNPQTPKIQDHHSPINLPTIFTLTSIYFVTFFERSLSGWGRAAFQSKVVRGCLGIDLLVTDIKIDCTAQDLKGCQGGHDCLGTEGVLRVSLGCFIFYFTMFLTTVGSTKLHESRDSWHSRWWPLKSLMWITLMVIPFLVPSAFIQFYGDSRILVITMSTMAYAASLTGIILMYIWSEPIQKLRYVIQGHKQ